MSLPAICPVEMSLPAIYPVEMSPHAFCPSHVDAAGPLEKFVHCARWQVIIEAILLEHEQGAKECMLGEKVPQLPQRVWLFINRREFLWAIILPRFNDFRDLAQTVRQHFLIGFAAFNFNLFLLVGVHEWLLPAISQLFALFL